MEKYEEARENALKNLKIADHMLTVTYPLVKDPKLLIAVTENLFLALTNSVASVLYYEQLYKRVPIFNDDFESKFNILKDNADRLGIDRAYLAFMRNIKEIIVAHRKSPVEFVRKNKFVIYTDTYNIKSISSEELTRYTDKTRSFVHIINGLVGKNARLLRKC